VDFDLEPPRGAGPFRIGDTAETALRRGRSACTFSASSRPTPRSEHRVAVGDPRAV